MPIAAAMTSMPQLGKNLCLNGYQPPRHFACSWSLDERGSGRPGRRRFKIGLLSLVAASPRYTLESALVLFGQGVLTCAAEMQQTRHMMMFWYSAAHCRGIGATRSRFSDWSQCLDQWLTERMKHRLSVAHFVLFYACSYVCLQTSKPQWVDPRSVFLFFAGRSPFVRTILGPLRCHRLWLCWNDSGSSSFWWCQR